MWISADLVEISGILWKHPKTELFQSTPLVLPIAVSVVHSPSESTIRCWTPAAFGPSWFLDEIFNNLFYNPTPLDYLDGSTTLNRATRDKIRRKSCWKWQCVLESHQFCMFIFSSCASRWVRPQQGNCQIAKHFHEPGKHKLFFLLHFVGTVTFYLVRTTWSRITGLQKYENFCTYHRSLGLSTKTARMSRNH
jgi:hypothetical protein